MMYSREDLVGQRSIAISPVARYKGQFPFMEWVFDGMKVVIHDECGKRIKTFFARCKTNRFIEVATGLAKRAHGWDKRWQKA